MAKIDIISLTGITASDGSVIASGATVKFDSEFHAANTDIRIMLKVYRNRELFEMGYDNTPIPEDTLPYDFTLTISEEEFYVMTPMILYGEVCGHLNNLFGAEVFEVQIITE